MTVETLLLWMLLTFGPSHWEVVVGDAVVGVLALDEDGAQVATVAPTVVKVGC